MNLNSINQTQIEISQNETHIKKGNTEVYQKTTSVSISSTEAAVYEKDEETLLTDTGYKVDMDTINAMKDETETRMIDLFKETVRNTNGKQLNGLRGFISSLNSGTTSSSVNPNQVIDSDTLDAYEALHGDFGTDVSSEAISKAKDEVSENGYWGANAVSDRFLDFAKALSGGDPSKAELLLDGVKQGYEAAEEIWGSELPQLSKDTLALTIEKFEAWRDGTEEATVVE